MKNVIYNSIWKFQHKRKGKVIWQTKKHNDISIFGEQSILSNYFRGDSGPDEFYIRLGFGTILKTFTLAEVPGEPSTNGYAPILIERSSVGFPTLELNSGDYRIVSKEVEFTASGGSIGPINFAFLASTNDTSGFVISFLALPIQRTILDGDSFTAQIRTKLRS